MVIFHRYVSLPEGKNHESWCMMVEDLPHVMVLYFYRSDLMVALKSYVFFCCSHGESVRKIVTYTWFIFHIDVNIYPVVIILQRHGYGSARRHSWNLTPNYTSARLLLKPLGDRLAIAGRESIFMTCDSWDLPSMALHWDHGTFRSQNQVFGTGTRGWSFVDFYLLYIWVYP